MNLHNRKIYTLFFISLSFFCDAQSVFADSYSTPGTYTYTTPSGYARLDVLLSGGGGGGAGLCNNDFCFAPQYYPSGPPNASGAAGGYSESIIDTSPGQQFSVYVGAGGSGGQWGWYAAGGGGGGSSAFVGNGAFLVAGGGGGGGGGWNSGGGGGGGGISAGADGTTLYVPYLTYSIGGAGYARGGTGGVKMKNITSMSDTPPNVAVGGAGGMYGGNGGNSMYFGNNGPCVPGSNIFNGTYTNLCLILSTPGLVGSSNGTNVYPGLGGWGGLGGIYTYTYTSYWNGWKGGDGYAVVIPLCAANYGSSCNSSANTCGGVSYGSIQCNGSCNAGAQPPNPSYYNTTCTSYPNACGQTSSGTYNCSYACSAATPALPAGYGTTCTSAANSCGQTSTGYTGCNGCTATTPANPSLYGTSCSLTSTPNACGQTTTVANSGTYNCSGTCSGTTPATPPVTTPTGKPYLGACSLTSPANSCGQTTTVTGIYTCSGVCSVTTPPAPSDATCGPSKPVIEGLYQGTTHFGDSAPAYDPLGYQVYARATTPDNADLTYYFEWSKDGVNWTAGDGPVGSPAGGWANVR